ATSIEKIKPESLDGKMMYITEKFDGIRCVCIVKSRDDIKFFSRNGKEILGLNDLKVNVQELFGEISHQMVFDGELLKVNSSGLNSGDLYRETVSIVNSKMIDKKDIEFHMFDMVTLKEFESGKGKVNYSYRREYLEMLYVNKLVKIAPIIYKGTDLNEVMEIGQSFIANGKEGIMINLDELYECKRVKHLIKVKGINSVDLEVIDIAEGTGQIKGMLGAVICRYKDGTIVNIGSGFSLDDRKTIWSDRNLIIGKIIEVRFTEESRNKNGEYSLRFPRFVAIRNDKDIADF
ncbi:ATP-dependent DNA ligase, partial [Cetobacterium sp.]|uniref:ATP-dependent DNA ligase n=1 Tax=Cetobacterium sp. TaxID=2071632 RepID=UPI003EE5B4B8